MNQNSMYQEEIMSLKEGHVLVHKELQQVRAKYAALNADYRKLQREHETLQKAFNALLTLIEKPVKENVYTDLAERREALLETANALAVLVEAKPKEGV